MKAFFRPAPSASALRYTLLLASALGGLSAATAFAADVTISTNQTTAQNLNALKPGGGTVAILSGVSITPGFFATTAGGAAYDVANAGTLTNPQGNASAFLGAGGSFTNTGTVTNSSGADGRSVFIFGGSGANVVVNSGTLRGQVELSSVIQPSATNSQGSISNAQSMSLTNNAGGVIEGEVNLSGGTTNTLSNSGTITGNVFLGQDTPDLDPPKVTDRVALASTKTLTNTATGVITGSVLVGGGNVKNIQQAGSTISFDVFSQGQLTNAGTIKGAVVADAVTNSGTITVAAGSIAVISYGNTPGGSLAALSGTLANSGTITGDIAVRTITNTGTINGNLLFGANNGLILPTDNSAIIGGLSATRTVVAGSLTNSGTVNGKITLASGSVSNSGTIGFGTAFGTSTVGGTYTHSSSATLVIKVNDAGLNDKLSVGGQAVLQGGKLSIAAADGAWSVDRTYTVLSAAGGISGTFSTLDISLPYLTPMLAYGANDLTLTLLRRTADIQESVVAETTEQQVSTSARKVGQTIDSRVDQAVSAAFITPQMNQKQNALAQPGSISGMAAGDSAMDGWGTWATITPTFVRQGLVLPGQTAAQRVTGQSLSFFAGADKVVGSRMVAGTFVSYETSYYDLPSNGGERKGHGPLVGAYAGLILNDWSYASAQVNYAWFSNRLTEGTFGSTLVSGSFDSNRIMASTTLTAYKNLDVVKLSGKAAYSYTRETFDNYTASDGAAVAPTPTKLGRVSTGFEIAGVGKTFVPYFSATYEWDVDTTGTGDKNGAVLGLGARYFTGRFTFDLYGSTQVGRYQERANSLAFNARFAF